MRNKRIFEHVAARLQKFGIDRDWKQCRTKYKNLKHEYKSVKDAQYSGNTNKSMRFFRELDAILGHNADKTSRLHNDYGEKPAERIKTTIEKKITGNYFFLLFKIILHQILHIKNSSKFYKLGLIQTTV